MVTKFLLGHDVKHDLFVFICLCCRETNLF